jgi:hypothetical protein
MSFINWGHETPEQKEIRRRMEDEMMFEQASYNAAVAAVAAAGSGGNTLFLVPPPEPGETLYYIRLLDFAHGLVFMLDGFFYVNDSTHIVQRFYDLANPTVDILSTGHSGGPTYLYYPGWLCFDEGGCNITSLPYAFGSTIGDYNMFGSTSSSNGLVGGFGPVTYVFSTTPF